MLGSHPPQFLRLRIGRSDASQEQRICGTISGNSRLRPGHQEERRALQRLEEEAPGLATGPRQYLLWGICYASSDWAGSIKSGYT